MCLRLCIRTEALRFAPTDLDPRRRFETLFASVHSASDSTPTHCSSGPFYRRAYSTLVSTSIHSTRAAMDAMDASGTDSVPVVCRRKTGGRCRSRPRGSSWALCSDAAAALACLVAFSLMGQAHAAYSCSTKADCNYDGCANRACSSSSSYCNNGVWDYGCVSTL
mgnify:CR=1 FL=1